MSWLGFGKKGQQSPKSEGKKKRYPRKTFILEEIITPSVMFPVLSHDSDPLQHLLASLPLPDLHSLGLMADGGACPVAPPTDGDLPPLIQFDPLGLIEAPTPTPGTDIKGLFETLPKGVIVPIDPPTSTPQPPTTNGTQTDANNTVQAVVSQVQDQLEPNLANLLKEFEQKVQQISSNQDQATAQPDAATELQASQELDALIADLENSIKDLESDPYGDVGAQGSKYNFPLENQPLVGVIDTGFDRNQRDIALNRITAGTDRKDGDSDPFLDANNPDTDHGQTILEIIAGSQNNNIGIDGVNDDAPLWLSRAVGSGNWAASLREFVDAAKASKQPNAIVNLSFDLTEVKNGQVVTRTQFTQAEKDAIEYARANNVLIVAASGNQGAEAMSALGKASQVFDNIITVGATDDNGNLADYSNYGAGLDLVAYGGMTDEASIANLSGNADPSQGLTPEEQQLLAKFEQLQSGDPNAALPTLSEAEQKLAWAAAEKALKNALSEIGQGGNNAVEAQEIVGTSIAAAKVSGAASQVWAANPKLSFAQVKTILKTTAIDLGSPGWDLQTGAGLLNLPDAVAMAASPPTALQTVFAGLNGLGDVFSGEGDPSERPARGFFKKLFNGVKKVFNKVVSFVNKVSTFVTKVFNFVNTISGIFSKISGIFSKVKGVFSWISQKFFCLPIFGKIGVILGGVALVAGAIGGLVWWLRNRNTQQPQPQPQPQPPAIPANIQALQAVWPGLPVVLKPALKNGINSAYGKPLFSGDPAGILPLMSTLAGINPSLSTQSSRLYQWLLYGTSPQLLPVLQGTATSPALPPDVATTWNNLNPTQKQELLKFLKNGVPPTYHPLFDGTDPDGIIPILNALGGLSPQAQNAISPFLPGGVPSQYQGFFP
jgi:Subtilase family